MILRWYHSYLKRRYEADLARMSAAEGEEPTFPGLVSQLCTMGQMRSPEYLDLCRRYRIDEVLRRKKWEYCYILQALKEQGQVAPGRRGLGFGVGRECVVPALAGEGCSILATDLAHAQATQKGWANSDQYAGALEQLNQDGLCDPAEFRRLVTYRDLDMNAIPGDLHDFDFLWSSCALEHLGSLEQGMAFVLRAMDCLKPGGVAVHTTEYNLSSNTRTVDHRRTVLFRRRDLEELAQRLARRGHQMAPLNLHPGRGELDREIDVPPYQWSPHLRLLLRGYAATSVGFFVTKAA